MKKQAAARVLFTVTGLTLAGLGSRAMGAIPVDGTLDTSYGSALSVQTINTNYGDSTFTDGTSAGGSELDALYGNVSNGTLYVFVAGNFENNGNHLNIYIADGRSGGQNVLNANASSGNLANENGMVFPNGFNATYCIDANDYNNTLYIDQYDLTKFSGNYIGSIPLTGGVGSNQSFGGLAIALNNTNGAGINGSAGTAADPVAAAAVTTGFEIGIPLTALGNPTGSIGLVADIAGGGNGNLSNQFLPGLPVGTTGNGNGASVNLSSGGYNSGYASVAITNVANGNWLPLGGGTWNAATNWSNSLIPNSPGAIANFASANQNSNVTLDVPITVGAITFNSSFTYNISAGTAGVLTLNGNGSAATITSYSGSQIISAPVVLASNASISAVSHGDIITMSGNISGPGSLTVFDQGGSAGGQFPPSAIILSGSNSYTGGTVIDGGNLQLGSANALPAGTLTLDAVDLPPGTLDINGFNTSLTSVVVTTGPNTQALGAAGHIINSSTTPGNTILTYKGSAANPSTFYGSISDSSGSGGATTSLAVTSGSLILTQPNYYAGFTNVSGGAKLTLGIANALPGTTNLSVGALSSVVITSLGAAYPVTLGTVNVSGQLDVTNNALIIHNSSLGSITSQISAGYHGGAWNGSGIITSTAAANTTHLTALGVIINNTDGSTALYGEGTQFGDFVGATSPLATDILVKYTFAGDANLDGVVDGSDYSLIDSGFLTHATGWFNGDFNYDGVINGSDYTLIDNSFNRQDSVTIAAELATTTAQIGGVSAVPEPTTLGLMTLATAGLLRRRKRAI